MSYLETNTVLCHNQHGFRSGRSCLTQMLSHFDDVCLGLTNNFDTDAIYLDYAKAFDKVDHRLLLAKLQLYGFSSNLLKWIESFLTDRKQSVVIDGHYSCPSKIISGVPQGTVLGPILFILFINDMENCVKHSKVRFFADDTRISKQVSSEIHVRELQEDLDSVMTWSLHNNMMLHEDKFQLMVHQHHPAAPLLQMPFAIEQMTYKVSNGETLYPVEQLPDLGVVVSSDLSWSPHIYAVVSKARSVASWVLSAFKARDKVTMCTLYKSLVRSHLEYCCPLWNPSKICDIQLLEEVQRTFTSKIYGVQHLNYWDRLRKLGLMSLQRRRERYILIQMWKILHSLAPNDVDVKFNAPSRRGITAQVPTLNRNSSRLNQTRYDSMFSVIGPRLWNVLPQHLTTNTDCTVFKHLLTDYLRSFPDTPPVSGYSSANGNSILDWCENNAEMMRGRSGDHLMTQ